MNLDRELRHAMARKQVPEGFSRRVLGRLDQGEAPRRRGLRWQAVAATIAVLLLSTLLVLRYVDVRRQQRLGEEAREQVLLALEIASEKVNRARDGIRSTVHHETPSSTSSSTSEGELKP